MDSLKINTLVFEHLNKISPNLALEFKTRHKCFSSYLTLSLGKTDVYKQMLKVTPELAKEFHNKHMVDQNLALLLERSLCSKPEKHKANTTVSEPPCKKIKDSSEAIEVITLSETELIDVTSGSESSSSESDSEAEFDANHNLLADVIPSKTIVYVTSGSESSSSSDENDSDSEIDEIMILKEENPTKNVEVNKEKTSKLYVEDEKLLGVLTSSSSSSSESDEDSDNDNHSGTGTKLLFGGKVTKKSTVTKPLLSEKEPTKNKTMDNGIKCMPYLGEQRHEYRPISESPIYSSDLRKILGDSPVDEIVLHILNQDILISQINFDLVVLAACKLHRDSHSIPESVKLGSFSPKDNNTMISNWNKLVSEMNICNPETIFKMFCKMKPSKSEKMKANVLGLYLSQGMEKLRLAADVFYHAKNKILNLVRGKVSLEEHNIIMEYMTKHGESLHAFSDLSKILNREHTTTVRRHYNIHKGTSFRKGPYTFLEDKLCISEIIKKSNIKTILEIKDVTVKENGKVDKKTLTQISEKLGRPLQNVIYHWDHRLKPLLLQFHAGTINLDVRRILANYLLEKNLVHMVDIPWGELLLNPQFAGHTSTSLHQVLNEMIISIQRRNNCKREDVTAQQIADYANEKFNPHKAKVLGKSALQKMQLVGYYKELIDSIEM